MVQTFRALRLILAHSFLPDPCLVAHVLHAVLLYVLFCSYILPLIFKAEHLEALDPFEKDETLHPEKVL
jgi:hypothetical protein